MKRQTRYLFFGVLVVLGGLLNGCQTHCTQRVKEHARVDVERVKDSVFRLYVAHVNDTHSHFTEEQVDWQSPLEKATKGLKVGGYPRVKRQVDLWRAELKKQGHEMLFLHAGDAFQGTGYFVLNLGAANQKLLNEMNIDAMVTGNHEFDKLRPMDITFDDSGIAVAVKPGSSYPAGEKLAEFIAGLNYPMLTANLDASKNEFFKPVTNLLRSSIFEVDGEKIGVFGITLQDMASIAKPGKELVFLPEIETATEMVRQFEAQGINKIVMISHVGYGRDQVIAAAVPGIDVVVGGHSHSFLGDFSAFNLGSDGPYPTIVTNSAGGIACVVQAGQHASAAGLLEAGFDAEGQLVEWRGGDTLLLAPPEKETVVLAGTDPAVELENALTATGNYVWIEEDLGLSAIITEQYKDAVKAAYGHSIATVPITLTHERVPTDSAGHGSKVASLVGEALFVEAKNRKIPADFSLLNAGGVRSDIPAGEYYDNQTLMELMVFGNTMGSFQLTGKEVKDVLTSVIARALSNPDADGCFPYTGRLRYTYDETQPEGSRLVSAETMAEDGEWIPIDDEKTYHVLANHYIASGNDGYGLLKQYLDANGTYQNNETLIDNVLFTDYVKALTKKDQPLAELPYSTTTIIRQ